MRLIACGDGERNVIYAKLRPLVRMISTEETVAMAEKVCIRSLLMTEGPRPPTWILTDSSPSWLPFLCSISLFLAAASELSLQSIVSIHTYIPQCLWFFFISPNTPLFSLIPRMPLKLLYIFGFILFPQKSSWSSFCCLAPLREHSEFLRFLRFFYHSLLGSSAEQNHPTMK